MREVISNLPAWPPSRLGELVEALARQSGLEPRSAEMPSPPSVLKNGDTFDGWMDAAAQGLGLEAGPVEANFAELEDFVAGMGPALCLLPRATELPSEAGVPQSQERRLQSAATPVPPDFLAVLKGGRRWVTLLAADLSLHRMPAEQRGDSEAQ